MEYCVKKKKTADSLISLNTLFKCTYLALAFANPNWKNYMHIKQLRFHKHFEKHTNFSRSYQERRKNTNLESRVI